MYNNSMINAAINETLNNMKAHLTIIPKSLGLVNSDYRISVYDNSNSYYVYNNSGITGCDDSTESLFNDELDYYKSLICGLTGLKSVKVQACSLKPVNKTTSSVWDKLHYNMDELVELFRPLWKLTYVCDEVGLHQDDYDYIDIDPKYNIDPSSYNSLFDLYYDLVLAKNNSSKNEDKNNGFILKYTAYLRALGAIIAFRFDEYYDEDRDEYYECDPDDDEYDDDEYDDDEYDD